VPESRDHHTGDAARPELADRIARYLDGEATDADVESLNEQLAADPDARDLYVAMSMQAGLMSELAKSESADAADANSDTEHAVAVASYPIQSRRAHGGRAYGVLLRYAAAAVFLIITALAVTLFTQRDATDSRRVADIEASGTRVATLTNTSGAEWEPGFELVDLGSPIDANRLRLRSGSVELLMASTTSVTLLGQSDVEMLGPNRCRLHRGRIFANVPAAAAGFAVETPTHTVVDLGTRFLVEVNAEGHTRVDVLEGRVDVHANGAPSADAIAITADQAYRFSHDNADAEPAAIPIAASFAAAPANTGAKLRVGQRDSNWRIVGPDGKRRLAEAMKVLPDMKYLRGGNESSWWITLPGSADVEADTRWAFEVRLNVDRADAASLGLRGRFSVDNEVIAVSVNGRDVPLTPNGQRYQHNRWAPFVIDPGYLTRGENVIRFEVYNASSAPLSPVALRVEWSFED